MEWEDVFHRPTQLLPKSGVARPQGLQVTEVGCHLVGPKPVGQVENLPFWLTELFLIVMFTIIIIV